jgi:hypothetical protein
LTRVLLSVAAFILLACCSRPIPNTVPIERVLPRTGVVVARFSVTKADTYAVGIKYRFRSREGRARAWRLSGGTQRGARFNVRLRLDGPNHQTQLVNVAHPKLTSWGGRSLKAELARFKLAPGNYVVELRVVDGRLPIGLPTRLYVVPAYMGK